MPIAVAVSAVFFGMVGWSYSLVASVQPVRTAGGESVTVTNLAELAVTNYRGQVISGRVVRVNRSHVFIGNADGVVRAMPYSAMSVSERERVRGVVAPKVVSKDDSPPSPRR